MSPLDRQAAELDTAGDVQLARRCCDGDERAREDLVRRHAPALYALVRRMVATASDAEDLLQEAFVQVFASLHTYRGEAPLKSWLRRIAVRCACRHHRRRRSVVELELVEDSPRLSHDPSGVLAGRALLRRIDAALLRLRPKRRAIFVLHEVEGCGLAEAAAILGLSLTAAKKLVWRARKDLERVARRDPELRAIFEARSAR
jgi:RNA polymerase sigma-70 factor (ECF subfamily)